ncbi:MAG: diguanylate cyclase [Janthinobacterium lividum]
MALLLPIMVMLAGSPAAQAQRLTFRQYSQDQGLANLGLQCLNQDRSGFVLVCTENGAARYDGREFEPFGTEQGLPGQGLVYDMEVAADGRLFVVFSNGVYVSAPTDPANPSARGHFTALQSDAGPIEINVAHSSAMLGNDLLLVERGQLRIGRASSGDAPGSIPRLTSYFSPAMIAHDPALAHIVSIAITPDGIWLGCGDGEACHVVTSSSGTIRSVTVFGPTDGLPKRQWAAFLRDRHGTLWARSLDLIARLGPGSSQFTVEEIPGGPGRYAGHTDRLVLIEAPSGHVLTQGRTGLLIHKGGVWRTLNLVQGVPEGEIVAIMFDREGSLWFAVRAQGVFRGVGIGEWENWTRNDGLSDNVIWQMSRSGAGPLWAATEGGTDALATNQQLSQSLTHLNGSGYVVAVTPLGRVWRATLDGIVSRFDPATRINSVVADLPPAYKMYLDPPGTNHPRHLWLATREGVYKVDDPDAVPAIPPVHIDGVSGRVYDLTYGLDGTIWVISAHELLHQEADGTMRSVLSTGNGINPSPSALAFAPDGTLWLGSGIAGIQRLHLDHDRVVSIDTIAMPMLGSNNVLFLRRDRRGWMWVGGDRGLDIWNPRESRDGSSIDQGWHHLDEEDGLLSNDLDEGSMFEDPDGSLWFGTGHGISHLLDPVPVLVSLPLHPVITSVLLGHRTLPAGTVAWSHDPLVVRFSALDYRDERWVRFRYKLTGVDRDWVDTAEREVRYPELPPGHLTFSVMAYDPLKRRTSAPTSFDIMVQAPWWRTGLFLIACALAFCALAMSIWRLRMSYLLGRQRQLEALVAERTREIEHARAVLFEQATRDSLTGLLNRPATMQAFDQAIERANLNGAPLAIALIDLDHFKSINDRFGHLGGDDVLREIARRLKNALQTDECAGRYGGEELVLILPDEARSPGGRTQQLRAAMVEAPIAVEGSSISVTCSVGVSWYRHGDTSETLLRRADQYLYIAKNSGRDRIELEPDQDRVKAS